MKFYQKFLPIWKSKILFASDNSVKESGPFLSSDESMKRQRLSLDGMKLNYKIINKVILHNGKALTVLNLRNCKGLYMGSILDIVQHCVELTEFNLASTNLCRDSLNFLANNLTPTVVKLSLQNLKQLQDKHVSTIVKRCNKITQH